jgi:exodeoxyribonuclease III
MHLVSWNVNGLRAMLKKSFLKDVKAMDPDILCMQETKGTSEDIKTALMLLPEYHHYVNSPTEKKGYSGTAILSKQKPLEVTYGLGIDEHDQEGRVITAEFPDFYLVTVYTPNSGEGLRRLEYRQEWDVVFKAHVQALEERKPVIICGDLNVAHTEMDLARPKQNYNKTSGYTQVEIEGLDNLLSVGLFDSFRHFYPDEIKFSWWNYKYGARERNMGWRIDYFLVSEQLKDRVIGADIYDDVPGSDHCPVALKLN